MSVQIDVKAVHEENICDVQPSQAHINEHPNIVLILTIHRVDSAYTNEIPFAFINVSTEDIYLAEVKMLWFTIKTDIELDEITKMRMFDTPFYDKDYCFEVVSEREENVLLSKTFNAYPPPIGIHGKVKLQDAAFSEQYKQQFKELCQ